MGWSGIQSNKLSQGGFLRQSCHFLLDQVQFVHEIAFNISSFNRGFNNVTVMQSRILNCFRHFSEIKTVFDVLKLFWIKIPDDRKEVEYICFMKIN